MKLILPLLFLSIAAMSAETNGPPNRPALTINADFSVFNLRSNEFLYTNNVVVFDPPAKPGDAPTTLTCRWAVAKIGASRKIESVIAHDGVAIDQGDKHGRSALAVYTASNEVITLTGAFNLADTNLPPFPVLYSPQGTTYGNKIIYDRMSDNVFVEKVTTILPQTTLLNTNRPCKLKYVPQFFGSELMTHRMRDF